MKVDTQHAHITCSCGEQFQVLVEPTARTDASGRTTTTQGWDEQATALAYEEHLAAVPHEGS